MFRNAFIFLLLIMIGPVSISVAAEESIEVVPGNYKLTISERSNMSPNPKIETKDKCIEDSYYNPEKFFSGEEGCSVSNIKKSGNKISFDMKCSGGEGMPNMTGKGEASAASSTISSHYKLAGTYQGRDFSWDSRTEGKRIGDCKE